MKVAREVARLAAYRSVSPLIRALLDAPNIDKIVNENAGLRLSEVGVNTTALVKLRRRNGDPAVTSLTPSDWDRNNIPARYFTLTRWLRRLIESRRRRGVSVLTGGARRPE